MKKDKNLSWEGPDKFLLKYCISIRWAWPTQGWCHTQFLSWLKEHYIRYFKWSIILFLILLGRNRLDVITCPPVYLYITIFQPLSLHACEQPFVTIQCFISLIAQDTKKGCCLILDILSCTISSLLVDKNKQSHEVLIVKAN